MDEVGWSVSEFADRLGVSSGTASRLLNGRCGMSPAMALALERIGWSNADFRMRRQANYDHAKTRRDWKRRPLSEISLPFWFPESYLR